MQLFINIMVATLIFFFGMAIGCASQMMADKKKQIDDFKSGYDAGSDYWLNKLKDYKYWFDAGWHAAFKAQAEYMTEKYKEIKYEEFEREIKQNE